MRLFCCQETTQLCLPSPDSVALGLEKAAHYASSGSASDSATLRTTESERCSTPAGRRGACSAPSSSGEAQTRQIPKNHITESGRRRACDGNRTRVLSLGSQAVGASDLRLHEKVQLRGVPICPPLFAGMPLWSLRVARNWAKSTSGTLWYGRHQWPASWEGRLLGMTSTSGVAAI